MKRSVDNGNAIKIRVSQLPNGQHEYHFSVKTADIGLDKNFSENAEINARVGKTNRQIYINADVQAQGVFQCDRCLDDFEQKISSTYNMLYSYNEVESNRYPAEEVQCISPDTVYIDLTEDVRQTILLAVPLKLLCKDNCLGLCAHCGVNLNSNKCNCKEEEINSPLGNLTKILKTENK
jgi:uncharacterized protein